jgi:lon-related putative ATP-dependent protease
VSSARPLSPAELRRRCDAARLPFETTAELPRVSLGLGQERAVEAVRFGIGIRRDGFNLYALGPPGMGKHAFVRSFLEERAAAQPTPDDWCYVANFADPVRPRALRLPAGRAASLRSDLARFIEELKLAIPAAFESEDYRNRKKTLETRFGERSEKAFAEIERRARERGIAVVRTPVGIALAPTREGEVMEPDDFQKLPEPEQARFRTDMAALQQEIQQVVSAIPQEARRQRDALRELDREFASFAVGQLLEELRTRYAKLPQVLEHLEALRKDVVDNVEAFLPGRSDAAEAVAAALSHGRGPEKRLLRRYEVNALVSRQPEQGAPIVYEDHPSVANLLGRVEHQSEFGSLVTDFTLIRPGALHRANDGYLVIDARRLLQQPYAWDELKRTLRARQIRIESLAQALSLVSTVSLEPEPIPLDVKIVLVGERMLYYLLAQHDPEFSELFKVAADFEEAIERDGEGETTFAAFLATVAHREGLRPLTRDAVACAVEHAARLTGTSYKLTVHLDSLRDLLQEADHRAGLADTDCIRAEDLRAAIEAQIRRADRLRERSQEEIQRGTVLIDTSGSRVGQLNGLSVLQVGGFSFGRPSRITARVRLGSGQLVDIEREVELGGPIHSKGVLILAGYLGARYAADHPLSLHASLVFEQSYSGIEGDSASCAELFALLSAVAEVPLRQSIAVTGSVNQLGQVQPIGGVNEKIEGFFDVCRRAGLTGDQGVLIPETNVKHLMLREDVVEAVAQGRFHVWSMRTIDEGLELLAGMAAGDRGADDRFPEASVNGRVAARLAGLAEKARAFARSEGPPREETPS